MVTVPPVAVNDTYSTNANTTLNLVAPGVLSNDNDPKGATLTAQLESSTSHGSLTLSSDGSFVYTPVVDYVGSDSFTYMANNGTTNSTVATVTIITSSSNALFSDDFSRTDLLPWVSSMGTWTITEEVLQGSGDSNNYSYASYFTTPQWTDYTVQGSIQIPAGSFGGGIGGRVDPATGAHYGAWIYPAGSGGGSKLLKLWKFRSWTELDIDAPMQQVSLPDVDTGWHTLQMVFIGNRILVLYDEKFVIDYTDTGYDKREPYLNGGISGDMWMQGGSNYGLGLDNIIVRSLASNTFTTTIPPNSTTTTTTPKPPLCAAEAIYGENSEQTELLRKYRDKVLSKTPEGREIIKTYYKLCPIIIKLFEQQPLLKNRAKAVIDSMLPGIRRKVEEGYKDL